MLQDLLPVRNKPRPIEVAYLEIDEEEPHDRPHSMCTQYVVNASDLQN